VKYYYETLNYVELRLYKIALFLVVITKRYTFRGIYIVFYGFFVLYILWIVSLFEGVIRSRVEFEIYLAGSINEYAIQ